MFRSLLIGLLLAVAGASVCHGASPIGIGTSDTAIAKSWHAGDPCIPDLCVYTTTYIHPLEIMVGSVNSRATSFEVSFDSSVYKGHGPSPAGSKYWKFLTDMLPADASKSSCRDFKQTGNLRGPAHACNYRWRGHWILVAHFTAKTPSMAIGLVALNENTNVLKPA
jgi:hypothetical protein